MKIIFLCLALLSFRAAAESRSTQILDGAKFDALDMQRADANVLYYNEKVLAFQDWGQAHPAERRSLIIYPEYIEPTVTSVKNGVTKKYEEKLMIFVARAKLILKKPAAQVNLRALINLETIAIFDKEIVHQAIQPAQFIGNLAGRGPVENFKWCNKSEPRIVRPTREVDLSHTNPKSRAWCNETGRSICVESCYLFSRGWTEGVKLANLALGEAEKKDYGIGMQSEIRYFSNERELGLPVPVKELTRIDSAVRGGLEQNIFYVNQVMEFGKVVMILQDLPDPTKSAVTAYAVVGIKKRTYNQFSEVRNVLLGQSILFNSKTGITAGLPVFSQNMIKNIADILER